MFKQVTGVVNLTTDGDYKIHTFTSDGNFIVSNAGQPGGSNTVDYLVVAGGGGGGSAEQCAPGGRDGGAGGSGIVIIRYKFQ